MSEVDYSKLDPALQEKIKKWQQESVPNKQLQTLEDLADMSQELINILDEQKKSGEKNVKELGATLLDIRDKLGSLDSKEAPEMPDYAKPIIKAIGDMQKALEASIKAIEVKPDVKVSVPDIAAPEVPEVDLSELEKIVKVEIPKAFEKAVKAIPTTPAVKLDPLENVIRETHQEMMNMLESIDTASRMKPQFPVSQLNSMKTTLESIDAKTASSSTVYLTKIDNTTTANVIYIGKALPGSTGAQNVWQIKRLDTSTLALDKTWADGNGNFDNVWNNRATTVVYS